jgi:ATP/maltotriose-dependent transcriptional regulator MalT
VVPRLCTAFASVIVPVVLILDDVHLLHNSECRAALSVLADHVPAGSRLVLAGRTEPPVRVARLRAEGRLAEIGPGDLSLTVGEAASLLHAAEVVLSEEDVADLHRRTEGWPAGLYLAALCLREGGSPHAAVASFGGDDRFVSEYVESEFLARISRSQRVFLTRTASLERMSGALCDAVLDGAESAAALEGLARSNMLLVPLDRRGQWYRYHHLFRDLLLAELERLEPGLLPALRRRAAAWYLANDSLRAILCRRGAEQMRADADEAARKFAAAKSAPISAIPLVQGTARVLCGDLDGADAFFADALSIEEERQVPELIAVTLCERSLVAMARSQWDQAGACASRARACMRQAGIEDSFAAALTSAAQARVAMHGGDVPEARRALINALRLRPLMTYAHPHWAVQARIALIRVHLALSDLAGARTIMREIEEILKRRPDLGTLVGEAQELRTQLATERSSSIAGASALTAAELRLLPMLSTHLQLHEIAAEVYLSPHTIRAQGKSIYRKLGASTRSQAVARARELGLLEG